MHAPGTLLNDQFGGDWGAYLKQVEKSSPQIVALGVGYLPNEVLANPKIRSPLQDIYACGVMLYECLAGQRPDPTDYTELKEVDESYGPLDATIKKAIAGAAKRTKTMGELHEQLQLFKDSIDD